jgi:hypothetical protein
MKTNTKKNFLKLAMTIVASLIFSSAIGQVQNPDYGLVSTDGNVSRITVGKTMPFYVQPDATYHPNYNEGNGWALTPDFSWTWTSPEFLEATPGITSGGVLNNYVEITANTVGDYAVTVRERAPAAWGGCEDGTGQTMTISVVPAPLINSYSATIVDDAVSFVGGIFQQCGPITDFRTSVNLTGFSKFQVKWSLTQRELDVNGNPVGLDNVLENEAIELVGADNLTITTESYVIDTGRNLTLIDGNKRTRYTFEILEITDYVSRRSDYLGGATWYGASQTFTVIVNPAPATGPIFHIPNTHNAL